VTVLLSLVPYYFEYYFSQFKLSDLILT